MPFAAPVTTTKKATPPEFQTSKSSRHKQGHLQKPTPRTQARAAPTPAPDQQHFLAQPVRVCRFKKKGKGKAFWRLPTLYEYLNQKTCLQKLKVGARMGDLTGATGPLLMILAKPKNLMI